MTRTVLKAIAFAVVFGPVAAIGAPTIEDLPGVPLETVREVEKITLSPNFSAPSKEKKAKSDSDSTASEPSVVTNTAQAENLPEQKDAKSPAKVRVHEEQSEMPTVTAVQVRPGENMILPVSKHPNRILTPFINPVIKTQSSASIETDKSVVYVSPVDDGPITMFVTERDSNQRAALSLTLVPRNIPPMEMRLVVDGMYASGSGFSNPQAEAWEKSDEYTSMLSSLMRKLALGEQPQGYGLRDFRRGNDPYINCGIDGIAIDEGQVLDGHNIVAVVGRAVNNTFHTIEFDEQKCLRKGTLAAAAWPRNLLAPGQETEVYVLFRRLTSQETKPGRPSLLKR